MISDIEEQLLEDTIASPQKPSHPSKDPVRALTETLRELVLDAPDINHAKVERLKKEIAAGTYRVSAKQIAMQMLSDMNI